MQHPGLSSVVIILGLDGIQKSRNIEGGQPQGGVRTLTKKSLCSRFLAAQWLS